DASAASGLWGSGALLALRVDGLAEVPRPLSGEATAGSLPRAREAQHKGGVWRVVEHAESEALEDVAVPDQHVVAREGLVGEVHERPREREALGRTSLAEDQIEPPATRGGGPPAYSLVGGNLVGGGEPLAPEAHGLG